MYQNWIETKQVITQRQQQQQSEKSKHKNPCLNLELKRKPMSPQSDAEHFGYQDSFMYRP